MRERRRRFEEDLETAVHETPVLPTDAVLALQRTAGNQATCRALQRVLITKNAFVGQQVETTTIQALLRSDPTLQGIATALEHYPAPPPTSDQLRIAQGLSALCEMWLDDHPLDPSGHRRAVTGWGVRPTATDPDVVHAVRRVIQRLQGAVQQELVELAGSAARPGHHSVFNEQVRRDGSAQTPPEAMNLRHGHQTHWEGWKIHVSVPASLAGDVAAAVVPQLEQENGWYKVRKRIDEYRNVSDDSAGKFIVIYPDSIAHLEQLLTRLESTLPALVGTTPAPAIKGDVQLDAGGYVWARYGVFQDLQPGNKVDLGPRVGKMSTQNTVIDPVMGGWVKDPRKKAIPDAWANQLLGQIQGIRQHRHTQALRAAEARGRPRAASA